MPKRTSILVGLIFLVASCGNGDPTARHNLEHHGTEMRIKRANYFLSFNYQYVFEVRENGSPHWTRVLEHIQDDPDPICRECLVVVSRDVLHFHVGSMFTITTDGGKYWHVFDVSKDSEFGKSQRHHPKIDSVAIHIDRKGILKLRASRNIARNVTFVTEDYGKTWVEQPVENTGN